MAQINERADISCSVLVKLLQARDDDDSRRLLVRDLAWKARSIAAPSVRSMFIQKTAMVYAPEYVRAAFQTGEQPMKNKPYKDVVFLTVIKEELYPSMIALGMELAEEPKRSSVNGLRFWEKSLITSNRKPALDIALTLIGDPGNSNCTAACSTIFDTYEVGLLILVGIAAGVEEKVKLGDVVSAELVIDYERARVDLEGAKKRPVPFPLDLRIGRDLQHFYPSLHNWGAFFSSCFEELKKAPLGNTPSVKPDWIPGYDTGVILSGEKKREDGSLGDLRESYHDRVRACEMEGAGFARACKEKGVPWLVFRGISDYGDPSIAKGWQTTAALAAACAAVAFLKHAYQPPAEFGSEF